MDPELSVVMPCLDEERTVGSCVAKAIATLARLGVEGEVVVVDNGSRDASVASAETAGARVVTEPRRGYGNALRRGFSAARGRFVLMADCDESYDLTDLERFLLRLRAGADLVMGNRLRGEIQPGAMKWLHRRIGNPALSRFLNLLFHTGVGDSHCGMRAFRREAMARTNLRMPGMEFASEMVIKSALAGLRIEEIPITLRPDRRGRPSHLRSFRDGWRHLRFMLMCSPSALFLVPGALIAVGGLAAIPLLVLAGYGVFTDVFGPNFLYTSAIAALAGFNLLLFGLLAKLHAARVDPVFRDPALERRMRWFTTDRGLVAGLGLMLAAAGLGLPVLLHWLATREVPVPGLWILACALSAIGIETVFASFLVGILELHRESEGSG
ncbi:MAG: glycosyltransferase family 2 protein [Thermoanaerobaculia bacterium]